MNKLAGKVAIVTGAGTGIGEAVAHRLAKEGAAVLLNGLPDDPLDAVSDEMRQHGAKVEVFPGDVSQPDTAEACVQRAVDRFGKLDILVNCAGSFQTVADVADFPVEDFLYMTASNIHTVFLMTRFAMPHLQQTGGCVISTGSEAGELGQPSCAPYGGAKAWIHGFMRSVALEQARHGVRANCVCPGPIATQWHDTDVSPMTDDMEQDIIDGTPMGRHGTTEEAANVYAFLASDEASFVTGALYFVDGGMSIGRGPIGRQVPEELRRQPKGKLELHHAREGLQGKAIRRK